jgi:hypothetical protein
MSKYDKLSAIAMDLARSLGSYVGNYKGSPYKEEADKALDEYKKHLTHWNGLKSEQINDWDRLESKIMTILSGEDSELSEIREKAEEIVEVVKSLQIEDYNKPQDGKSYIIVYDTFGDGLISDPGRSSEVEIFHSKEELDCGIVTAYYGAEDILDLDEGEDAKVSKLAIQSLVICEAVRMDDYVRGVVEEHLKKEKEEDYQIYLKLKEKFETISEQKKMKATTSKKIKIREAQEVDYAEFTGTIDQIMSKINRYKVNGWEGIDVSSLYWDRGAVYELYKYRDETEAEAAERIRVEGTHE